MPDSIRILIADDHAMVRDGLRLLLEAEPHFQVVGEAADGSEAVRLVQRLQPDILLLDMAMPRVPGMEALRILALTKTRVRSILLTASIQRREMVEALQLGARGVVFKESATQVLLQSIEAVMANQYWVGRDAVLDVDELLGNNIPVERPAGR